jgi:murein DD-endopeptidase MepM/ murein hydrolase activator NlpD
MRRTLAVTVVLLLTGTIVPVAAQDSIHDARARRETVQEDAADTAAQIDELKAEDADIVEALAEIDAWVAIQESNLARAQQQLEITREVEAEANARAEDLGAQINELEARVQEQIVQSYIGGFRNNDELLLGSEDINDIPLLRFVLDESAGAGVDAGDLLRLARSQQSDAIREAEVATAEALAIGSDVQSQITDLEESRRDQERVRAEVTARIAVLVDTAEILAAEDQEIGDFIRAEQERIRREEEERLRLLREEQERRDREAREAEAERAEAEQLAEAERAEAEQLAEAERAEAEQLAEAERAEAEQLAEAERAEAEQLAEDQQPEPETEPEPRPDPGPGVPNFSPPVNASISSGYGYRTHPIFGNRRLHTGLDYNAANGSAIGAAAEGTVILAGSYSGYGNTVIVQHSGGYTTLYAHMSSFNVSTGATVSPGDVVGFVGSTGLSTGPHLHFEIRLNGFSIDPLSLL